MPINNKYLLLVVQGCVSRDIAVPLPQQKKQKL
jgi:hypothetical protein